MTRARQIVAVGLLVSILLVALANAEVVQNSGVRLTLNGQLEPHRLPRSDKVPVAVSIRSHIATTDQGVPPPQLRSIQIELNRHGRIDHTGLPVCPYDRLEPASTARALAACRASLVGRGNFWANVALSGQEPYPSRGKLLLFNGRRHNHPVLLGHIYSARPFATSFVIVFSVRRNQHGPFGTVLEADLSPSLRNWGYVTGIELTLQRRYSLGGEQHSFISASCPAPAGFPGATYPLARVGFKFSEKLIIKTSLTRNCRTR